MQLPNNSDIFKNIVTEKIRTYCDTKIWPYEYDQFAAWLHNFDCKIEEYIALQLLDNLIVRSKDMAKSSYSRLLDGQIRQHLIQFSNLEIGTIHEWKNKLSHGTLANRLSITPVQLEEGGSGNTLYRMLSPEIDTKRYSLSKSQSKPEVIIIIDDIIGSGKQFLEFARKFNLAERLQSTQVLYCPLIGFEVGITNIQEIYPNLHIIPAEHIYKSDSLFYGDEKDFFKNDRQNTIGDVKAHLKSMQEKYAPNMSDWFGFEDAALPLTFEWGCPNQSPALLYIKTSKVQKNWQQLFSRRS